MVEMLVALIILALALAAIMSSLLFVQKSCYDVNQKTDLNTRTGFAMQQLGQDLRSTVEVQEATPTRLKVKTKDSTGTTEVILYKFDASKKELVRTDGSGNERFLFLSLDEFKFVYHTSKNAVTTSIIDIKKVTVSLKQDTSVLNRQSEVEYFSARFLLRNRLAG